MLPLNPYQKLLLLALGLVFAISGCKKQIIPSKPEAPHLLFHFIDFRRLYNNQLEVNWTAAGEESNWSHVKYTLKLNGKLAASDIARNTATLDNVLPTLTYSGWVIATDDTGLKDSVDFEVPAERIFLYSNSTPDYFRCVTNTGLTAWDKRMGMCSLPAIIKDTVFVEGGNGVSPAHALYALNANTGSTIWSVPGNILLDEDAFEVIYEKGIVYAVSHQAVSAHRSTDGKLLWQMKLYENDQPWVNDNTFLTEGAEPNGINGYLRAYNARTGELKWFYEPLSSRMGYPTEKDNVVYVVDCHGTWPLLTGTVFSLKALDVNSGLIKWQTVYITGGPSAAGYGSRPLIIGNTVYVAISTDTGDQYVYAYNKDNGHFEWSVRCYLGRLAGDASGLLVMAQDRITCLHPQNGKTIWMKAAYDIAIPTPDKIYTGNNLQYSADNPPNPFKIMDRSTGEEDIQIKHNVSPFYRFTVVIDGKPYYSPESGMYKGN